ncbi:MAG: YbaN family protein [Halomonas sp.]|nr:YbaN family protein [Halomonas sp.]MDN6297964.1 YbaN family protein [Halomonas sp.]MDN6314606.1 YbaN family protein [Halomonas sp.]MDN6336543.1 YbaN family protein [Halomonas sp.]
MRFSSIAWCALAYLCVGLGAAGIVLPLLPTTPFLLLALWAAAKGSPRLARWLLCHPHFGPYLHAWREQRAIPPRAKLTAYVLLGISFTTLWFSQVSPWLLAAMALFFSAIATFIATRPNPTAAPATPRPDPPPRQ